MSARSIEGRFSGNVSGVGVSLLDGRPGRLYRVGPILFETVRQAFAELGIREGTLVRVEAPRAGRVNVRVAGRAPVAARLEFALFVPLVEVPSTTNTPSPEGAAATSTGTSAHS